MTRRIDQRRGAQPLKRRGWAVLGAVAGGTPLALALLISAVAGEAAAQGGAISRGVPAAEVLDGTGARLAPPTLLEEEAFPTPRPRPENLKTVPLYDSAARNALIIDLSTNRTLYEKDPARSIPPASMTKLMTLYVALEAVRVGRLKLDTRLPISREAAAMRGSSMGLKANQLATLGELIDGLIITSGNDAAVAIAESVGGKVELFVEEMNETAEALGMRDSSFRNPSGLPARGHRMSLYDLATLSHQLMIRHPEAHAVFAERHFTWNGVRQRNRNPLLFADLDDIDAVADGLKTGFTNEAGYCAVITAARQEGGVTRRILAVIAGLPSEAARRREAERAIRWAFSQ